MVFVGDLLDDVERTVCVDTRRVFVTGLSNGAMMTSAVACAYSTRFAAAAAVAGITDPQPCTVRRPVPMLAFHGTADPFLAYGGGFGPKVATLPAPDGSGKTLAQSGLLPATTGPSVPQVMAAWASRDGCGTSPTMSSVAPDVTRLTFSCPPGVAVELYRVEGGGHAWPGSKFSASIASVIGPTTMSVSADAVMWDFFQAHPAPG
jgi:polyhydroxybutyrate depolymerase